MMRAAGPLSLSLLPVLAMAPILAGAAHAQAVSPPLMPARDVAVLYSVQPDGAPQAQTVQVYFQGGGGMMRVDGPPGPDGAPQGDMVLDRAAKTMTVVLNGPRIYMQIPEREQVRSPFVLDASMQFTRTGTGSVAGLPCVQWSIVSGKGSATACVTHDGVVLSESGVDGDGAKGQLVARTVTYGPLQASLFMPPAGYQRSAHPQGLGEGMGPGGGEAGPVLTGPQAAPSAMQPGTPGQP